MMKVLVTGANGQIGYLLAQKLALENDVDLLAVDKTELDIVNSSKVAQIFDSFKPDVVINAAAYTAVDKAETEKEIAYAVNCIGPKNLAEAAEKYNALMVHISTDYVFSGDKSGIYHEDDITGPATVYGKTKLDGENAVVQACRKHIIIRTAWVFGEHGNNFVKTMLRIAQSRSQLGIVADQVGGPTYAGDIADALIKIIQNIINDNNEKFGIYHFSGLPHVSWSEFAEEIFDAASKEGVIKIKPIINPISTLDYPTPARRPVNSRLDTQRITRCFGIEASNWKKALHSIKAYKS
ncbi:dTDP-4-dehydrorhamnose reductase [Enterobacter roggenkampii]|jgi:dTDP-4-dehydrorhamnose reductase|uniref:dTDP-4-dehydrorhamnose reductase n=1 Tax=Enterobacter roggenkampii TaxID=1812935 RepID=UPI00107ED101|nr:dTDP-4-dehydrorhamnose reductase [Enterobacter roggenkampii]QBX83500.1 dTDP-4-dehydrorhamnose reductase [Enterobacter roggenkampii]